MMYEEFQDRVGELITGIIQQSDNRYTLVQLRDRVEALLPRSEQIYSERYDHGMRIKAVITDVSAEGKGPSIVVSRKDPELIKKLFALEVPEIADELVEVVGVAREPGFRSKIAVVSHADGVDPVGACVGPRGSRVRMVVSELRGEKIDIIPYNEEPARFVAKALSPARVREVLVDDEEQAGDRDRPRRPALAGDRPRGPERPPRREADRLARRHRRRDRVRRAREDEGYRGRGGGRSTAAAPRCSPPAVAARTRRCRAPATAACRPAPGAGPLHDQPGHGALAARRGGDRVLADPDAADDVVEPIVARAEEAFAAADEPPTSRAAAEEVVDEASAEAAPRTPVAGRRRGGRGCEAEAEPAEEAGRAAAEEDALEDAAADAAEDEATAEGAEPEEAVIARGVAEEPGTEAARRGLRRGRRRRGRGARRCRRRGREAGRRRRRQ